MTTILTVILTAAVTYFFSVKLENYRFEQLQKQKAEATAAFIAKWIKYRGKEENFLTNKRELLDYYEELNRMSFELSLWIEDEKFLTDLMVRLQNGDDAKDTREILGNLRKLILNLKNDDFDSKNITIWPAKDDIFK